MGNGRGSSCIANSSVSSEQQMNIYLKIIKTVAFNVKRSDTISNLKALLCEKEGISQHFQELYFSGERLNDEDHKLIDCGIQNNSTLHLFIENSGVTKLFVTIVSKQRTIEIEAKSKETVENIKSKVGSKEGILSHQFSLFYAGTLLENNRTLASLGIKGESMLHLVFNQRVFYWFPWKCKIVKTEVKLLCSVADFKAFIGSMAGFPIGDQCLLYERKELEDTKTLACYDLKEDSFLKIGPCNIQIFVKFWNRKTIKLFVQQKETIEAVKKEVFRKLCLVPKEIHCLAFGGECLEDGRDLASYGIEKESTLHIVYKLRTCTIPVKLSAIGDFETSKLSTTTIGELKKLIETKWKRPVKEVLLRGEALKSQYSLRSYAIDEDTMLDVHFQNSV